MLWGQYPELVHGPTDSYVDGMTYVVGTEEQQKMLEYYETDVYSVGDIQVIIEDKKTSGRTFLWAGHLTQLVEGGWSLVEWKKRLEEGMASHFRPLED
jgi:hypothetical protein